MDELKALLAQSVPYLGAIIGTASPIAGVLFNAVAGLFGLGSNAKPEDLTKAIQGDPEAQIKLRSLEIQHSDEILHAETQIRLGAYSREIEVSKATGHHDPVLSILAFVFVGGFFLYSFFLFFVHIDATVHDIVLLLAGQISSMATIVGGYYFGSMMKSHTSIQKQSPEIILPPPAKTR